MTGDIPAAREAGRPTRILVVAHDAMLYGAQRSLLEILGRIDRSRFEPHVVIPSSGPFTDALRELGISFDCGLVQRWIFFPKPMTVRAILRRPWRRLNHPYLLALLSWLYLPARIVLLALLIRKRQIDLVYTNTITVLDGALAARIVGIPHIWHLREAIVGNADLATPLPVGGMANFALRWSAVVVTNSYALARSIFGTKPRETIKVIHNGVDLRLRRNHGPTENIPYLPAGSRLTAICGAVQARKDVLTYIRSAAHLRISHPNLHHFVIGRGNEDYLSVLKGEIALRGLTDKVHFLRYRNDVLELFPQIDILISTAISEPFGRTLIEAMAAGKPVISTRSGGPEEIIVDGECGYLVDAGDDAAIAERIARLLDDAALYEKMSLAARERVEKNFDLKVSVRKIEQIFDEVVSGHRTA